MGLPVVAVDLVPIVEGYSLPAETTPSLFAAAGLEKDVPGTMGDICRL